MSQDQKSFDWSSAKTAWTKKTSSPGNKMTLERHPTAIRKRKYIDGNGNEITTVEIPEK